MMARPRLELLLAALAYALLTLCLFGSSFSADKLFVPMHTDRFEPWRSEISMERTEQLTRNELPGLTDKLLSLLPDDRVTIAAHRDGRLPLWNPNIAGGAPHLAQALYGVFYPLNQVFRWVDPERAFAALAALLHFMAALFTFLFVRRIGGAFTGSFLAGFAFSFSTCLIYRVHYYPYIEAFAFMPLGLYLVERWFDRRSLCTLALLALLTACVMLTGWPQASIYTISTWVFLALFRSLGEDLGIGLSKLVGAGLVVLATGTAIHLFLDASGRVILLAAAPWVGLLLCFLVSKSKRPFLVRMAWIGGALLAGGLVSAIQYLPAAEWAEFANRSGSISPIQQAELGMRPWFLLTGLFPDLFGTPEFPFQTSLFHLPRMMALSQGLLDNREALHFNLATGVVFGNLLENSFYFGLPAILLAPLGLLLRSPRRGYLAMTLVLFVGVCLGVAFILYPLYYGGFAVGKDSRRTLVVIAFACCCLFGLGVAAVGQGKGRRLTRSLALLVAAGALAALLVGLLASAEALAAPLLDRAARVATALGVEGQVPPADAVDAAVALIRSCLIHFGWLGLATSAALLLLTTRARPVFRYGALTAVLLFDLGSRAWPLTRPQPADGFLGTHPLIEHLQQTTGREGRIAHFSSEADLSLFSWVLPPNLPEAYGLMDAWCYTVFPPRRWMKLAERIDPSWNLEGLVYINPLTSKEQLASPVLDLMAVRSIIGKGEPPADLPEGIRLESRFGSAFVLENEKALPRVFTVAAVDLAGDADETTLLNRLLSKFFDRRHRVLIEGEAPPALDALDPAKLPQAELVREEPERLTVKLEGGSGAGVLVVLDSYAPGWTATVNGKPAPVLLADFAFRAVLFPPGSTEVILTYEPKSVQYGAAISLAALALILFTLGLGICQIRRGRLSPSAEQPGNT
ncbi:MAG: hypothetical protein V2A76_19195 [Planctomycetota bacterium]